MATKIRLARGGSKKRPYYRIVVADSRAARDGRFIEKIGTYNPMLPKGDTQRVTLKQDRIKHWLSTGAIPSDKVLTFINDANLGKGYKHIEKLNKRRDNIIALKAEEIAARKKAEAEKAKAEAEAKAKEETEAKAAEEAAAAETPAEEEKPAEDKADKAEAEKSE